MRLLIVSRVADNPYVFICDVLFVVFWELTKRCVYSCWFLCFRYFWWPREGNDLIVHTCWGICCWDSLWILIFCDNVFFLENYVFENLICETLIFGKLKVKNLVKNMRCYTYLTIHRNHIYDDNAYNPTLYSLSLVIYSYWYVPYFLEP